MYLFTNPVLYLLCLVLGPSMDPSSTPVEGGYSLCLMFNSKHRSGHQKGYSRKDFKSRAWVPLALVTPSILSPTVHQNLPKPFCHMQISVTPNRQKHWILNFFQNKCLGSVILLSWIHPFPKQLCILQFLTQSWAQNLHIYFNLVWEIWSKHWKEVSSPSPFLLYFPSPTQHLHYINILSLVLEFDVKDLHREIDGQKQERNKKETRKKESSSIMRCQKRHKLFGWLEHRMLKIPSFPNSPTGTRLNRKWRPHLHWNLMASYKYTMNRSWNDYIDV